MGILSSRFHDFIKPRRHILLEPNMKLYESFLKPLLDAPESRYTHLPWNPRYQQTFSDLFEKGYLPEQTERPRNSCELNDSLLCLANITYTNKQDKTRFLLLRNYLDSMLESTWLHQYGFVRIIALVPTAHVDTLLPRSISKRGRLQTLAEAVTSEVIEVTGDTNLPVSWTRRGLPVLQKSLDLALERTTAAGLQVPKGREAKPLLLAPKPSKTDHGATHEYVKRPMHAWHNEYIQAMEQMDANGTADKNADTHKRWIALRKRYIFESTQIKAAHEADYRQELIDGQSKRLREVLAGQKSFPTVKGAKKMVTTLNELTTERDQILSTLGTQYLNHHYSAFLNERRAFGEPNGQNSPLLLWDKRPYEPLHVEPSEFTPKIPCSVLDIRPNPNSPILQAQREYRKSNEFMKYLSIVAAFRVLLRRLNTKGKQPIDETLRLLFVSRSMADLPGAIPSLAEIAIPKITTEAKEAEGWKSVRSNGKVWVGYDADCLSGTALQCLPSTVLWDTSVEWHRWCAENGMPNNVAKYLGGDNVVDLDEAYEGRG
ncbi:hypothetical protein FQN57_004453 [Myotisia sp. PD_48]|nr:hypothetical protein FQN57_004453 [Myotisia sp. PD_48]